MPDKIDRDVLANQYGFNLAFFKSHPELYDLFKKAVAHNYDSSEFIARLRGTKWFKNTSDTARQWAVLNATDPKTAKQRLDQRIANVKQMAGRSGVSSDPSFLEDMARKSLMLGWDDAQLQAHLGASFDYNPDKAYGGSAGNAIGDIRKIASSYLVPVSDGTLQRWARAVVSGTATADDYVEYAKQQAKSLMPALSKQIDAGMTVRDLIDPYAQLAEKNLGISADSIDFTQGKWRKAVDVVDPKTNERSMMSLSDWERTLKTDSTYGYDKSAQGRTEAAQFTTKLAQMMGVVG